MFSVHNTWPRPKYYTVSCLLTLFSTLDLFAMCI